jgi:hypothetical protein
VIAAGEFALFLAAAHAVAPQLVDAPDLGIENAPPCRSGAQLWARICADDRARAISSLLSSAQIERVHRVLDAMCRELAATRGNEPHSGSVS